MERRQDSLAPFSSDEYPNSGEDSDEDVVTDYTHSEYNHASCLTGMNLCTANVVDTEYSKDNTVIKMSAAEEVDGQPNQLPVGTTMQQQQHQQQQHQSNPLVPIISVTPHSPGINSKHYLILEDNLQHLHEIHDSIQRMRELTLKMGYNNRIAQRNSNIIQRMSASCPTLCQSRLVADAAADCHDQDAGSDPDLITNCSTNSSPTHFPSTHSQILQGIDRRRSWADLEDARQSHRKCSVQNHLQAQNMQRHSISLGSLDSEIECSDQAGIGNRQNRSQNSTQSLNEADFVVNDFKKVTTNRASKKLEKTSGLMPGVTGPRLPLQKSISTPSIVIPPANNAESGTHVTSSLTASRHEILEKGSESETETEDLHIPHDHEFHEDLIRVATSNTQTTLDELLTDGLDNDDQHLEKPKKRPSLFFRKKKDKSGRKPQQHQWATIIATTQGNSTCDFCMKHCGNKQVLHCETCGAMVHQSQPCKDQFHADCTKSKSQNKGVSKSISNASIMSNSGNVKRGSTSSLPIPSLSSSGSDKRDINGKKAVTSYSPWRRVATKLGVNQTINEEKDGDGSIHNRDLNSGLEDLDFGDDVHTHSNQQQNNQWTHVSFDDLDPELGLNKEEPDSWSAAIGRNVALRLVDNNEREIKRQEHIYEFVLTEKHHCLVLLAMERIFAEGIRRHIRLGGQMIERMFPRLRDLIEIHLRFLLKLRKRQAESQVVMTIADILVEQFSSTNSYRMKSAYGEFCSRHRDAVDTYKSHLLHDTRFARFVRLCQTNPLLKKKGIPECILFVTQRLTKYPLLIEPLIKTGSESEEGENLRKALSLVKDILSEVDARVADKDREDRKIEIYNRIDAKSFAYYRGAKFKKSDIMDFSRSLKFEGTANLMQGRGKMATVVVIVLSDVLFFLAETRDQKYAFFVPDNKAGVVSLQKLLVREKAGQESRGIYLISSNPTEPEMFELKVQKPKDKQLWIQAIRAAVEACPQEIDNENGIISLDDSGDSRPSSMSLTTAEDRLRIAKAKETQKIISELRKKDMEQALLLEQKMSLQMRLLHVATGHTRSESDSSATDMILEREVPDYTRLVRNEGTDSTQLWNEVVMAVQEATRLASSLSYNVAGGASLSRSLSSAGERHSEAYVPPALSVPRRAETFAGFDYNKEKGLWHETSSAHTSASVLYPPRLGESVVKNRTEEKDEKDAEAETETETEDVTTAVPITATTTMMMMTTELNNKYQQEVAIQLSHYIYTLLCIISNLMTTIDSLQAQLSAFKEGSISLGSGGLSGSSRANPNRQLEELRNLQDQLTREKELFRTAMQQEKAQLEEERNELARQKEQLAAEQRDVSQQRDQLYRRLEALERQGIVSMISTGSPSVVSTSQQQQQPVAAITLGTDTQHQSRKADIKRIPLNLISATNQQKVQNNLLPIKQQLPLKLASSSSNNNLRSSGSRTSNSPDRHLRSGSSPVIVTATATANTTGSAYSSPDLGYSLNNGNLSQFHASSRLLQSSSASAASSSSSDLHQPRTEQALDEEVIFF